MKNEKTKEQKLMHRIVFRHTDGLRHTIFAEDTADLIYKLSNLNGILISVDTKLIDI